jgi:hypothetical protein
VPQNNEFTGPGQYEHTVQEELQRQRLREIESPAFKATTDRDPFRVNSDSPGPGEYEIELSDRALNGHKLQKCIDGCDRGGDGIVFGERVQDTPGPGKYYLLPEKRGNAYIRHAPRYQFGGKEGPAPDTYHRATSMVKPSMNVTYSCFKL